jgi:DNA-directed RNA polymerase subunit M/transcription elongation factor TFIIS
MITDNNKFEKIYGNSDKSKMSTFIYDAINNYVINTYKHNSTMVQHHMINYITNKIIYHIDSDSSIYDPKFFNMIDENNPTYEGIYNIISNAFSGSYWNDLNIIEIKRKAAVTKITPNTTIICGSCKEKKIYMYQKQTRGADEAMTQYHTCLGCGNKWTI